PARVADAALAGLVHRHGVGRGCGLEADAEEDHLPVRVLLGDAQRVQRGVDDAYVAALAAHLEQVPSGAGHAEHVAEGAEDHVGSGGDLQGLVDDLQRGHAHRAAGSVDQLDAFGEKLVDAVPDDGVRLPAAHLHQRPRPGHRGLDVVEQPLRELGILEFVDVLHCRTSPARSPCADPACAACSHGSPNSSSSMPRFSNSSRVRRADSSSSRCRAKPTWTMAYSPTFRSGRYSRHTSLTTPPKSTVAIRVPSRSSTASTLPGTARHMRVSSLLMLNYRAPGTGPSGDDEL